jgi:two-component system chemotaxis sensor kinase CheA
VEPRDTELLARLLPTFRAEADEHARRVGELLAALEHEPGPEAVEEAFREVHSLKGAARAVALVEVETLCQEMESVFARWRKERSAPSPAVLEHL